MVDSGTEDRGGQGQGFSPLQIELKFMYMRFSVIPPRDGRDDYWQLGDILTIG